MITVTLKNGLSRQKTCDIPEGTTIGDIVNNPTHRAELALPESVNATINGRTVGYGHVLDDGDVVLFERQAASKAA